jgi:PKHD-type hydroxylase
MHSEAFALDLFTEDECDQILKLRQKLSFKPARVVRPSGVRRSLNRICETAQVPRDADTQWIYERVFAKASELNDEYWQFDLDGMEPVIMVSYGFLNHFGTHMDSAVPSVARRKVSVSVQLSAPSNYLFGRLYVRSRNKESRWAPKRKGSAIFFPSHLWHSVWPVLWGRRHCLVFWITGEKPLR